MRKVLLFILIALIVAQSALYFFHAAQVFSEEMKQYPRSMSVEEEFPFKTSANQYPYSPFLALERLIAVMNDSRYYDYADAFYQSRHRWNPFDGIVGYSPAYYDAFFFAALGYFLLLSFLGWFQRLWANATGLGFTTILARLLFATALAFLYTTWIRESLNPESLLARGAKLIHPVLIQPQGIAAITALFSAFIMLACIIASIVAFVGLLGRAPTTRD